MTGEMDDFLKECKEIANSKQDLTEEKLGLLSKYIGMLKDSQSRIAEVENTLKKEKEKQREISEKLIPDFLQSFGMDEIKMNDGSKVSVKTTYACRISEKNKYEAHTWLKENGLGDIIKTEVKINSKQNPMLNSLIEELTEKGVTFVKDEGVHASTLKAVVKEQIETGVEIPRKTFSIFEVKKTSIK